jgi:hypothetical protein
VWCVFPRPLIARATAEDIAAGHTALIIAPAAARQQAARDHKFRWQRDGGVDEVIKELHKNELRKPGANPLHHYTGPVHRLHPDTVIMHTRKMAELFHMVCDTRTCTRMHHHAAMSSCLNARIESGARAFAFSDGLSLSSCVCVLAPFSRSFVCPLSPLPNAAV